MIPRERNPRVRKGKYYMINMTLTLELDDVLRSIGNECRRLGGYWVPKTMILRALTRVLQSAVEAGRVDLRDIFSEEDLVDRLARAFSLPRKKPMAHPESA